MTGGGIREVPGGYPALGEAVVFTETRRRTIPTDAQRATFERMGGDRGANPLRLSGPGTTSGIASIRERRLPKRLVCRLDLHGRRIRWDAEQRCWVLHPWKWDPVG